MKRILLILSIFLILFSVKVFSQGNEVEAYDLTNTELGGTARSISMAGAFGALGGDISVISNNPAGLGIYRSSEVSGTFDLSTVKTSTEWRGMKMNENKTKFSPSNIGFEFYFPTSSGSIRNWNLGFSYNRIKNYNRKYRMKNKGQDYSMADYVASKATNAYGLGKGLSKKDLTLTDNYDPYKNLGSRWLSVLGYEAGYFEHYAGGDNVYQSSFGNDNNGVWTINSPNATYLNINESGYVDEYNFGFGMNISDFMFLGASLSVTDLNYRSTSFYGESFETGYDRPDDLYMDNYLNTEGTAASINIGAITNFQMLRIGVAYNSPRWYNMTDYYNANAGSYINAFKEPSISNKTPDNAFSEYRFKTPGKWIFSSALILGQSALVSVDYELMNYKEMTFSDKDGGYEDEFENNKYIDNDFTYSHTVKIGTEIKVDPQFAVRAGYMIQTSPMSKQLYNNKVEVLPSGTLPHFNVVEKPANYFTVGFGYRFTPNFYMDMACVYRYHQSKAYAFSNLYHSDSSKDIHPVSSTPADLKTKSTRVLLTLGYKF
jgi:hypothetical protein